MLNVTDSAALAREWRFSRRAEHFGVQVGANRFGYVYEAIGNRTWASSNGIASVARDLTDCGTATNEAWTVGGEAATLVRTLDAQGRVSSLALSGDGYAQAFAYDVDGRLAAVSNAEAVVAYAYTPDGRNAGCTLTLANGTAFTRSVVRDPFRRDLVARIENRVSGVAVSSRAYAYDALSRPVSRNADTFGYNARGEVVSSHGGTKNTEETYAYDHIGNAVLAAFGGITNAYTANALNQYASILRASVSPCEPTYDADGNMTSDGTFSYAYDAASRLVSVSSNGVTLVTNFYDSVCCPLRLLSRQRPICLENNISNLVIFCGLTLQLHSLPCRFGRYAHFCQELTLKACQICAISCCLEKSGRSYWPYGWLFHSCLFVIMCVMPVLGII